MPFITEELWEQFGEGGSLMLTAWPNLTFRDPVAEAEIDWVVRIVSEIRTARAEMNVPPSAKISLVVKDYDPTLTEPRLAAFEPLVKTMARLENISFDVHADGKGAVQLVVDDATLLLPLADIIDLAAERARLEKEIGKLDAEIAKLDGKLNNEAFMSKAKPEVVEEQRERRAEADAVRRKLADAVKRIAG
jgi:valyl-tRNA synthetase